MSWARVLAVLIKEFRQVRRDKLTFGMMVGVPIIQLLLFGYAINSNPKHLPTAVLVQDHSEFSRSFVAGLENSQYFQITRRLQSQAEGDALLAQGEVQFMLVVPSDFSRKLLRGEHPAVLLAGDATDPSATGNALATLSGIAQTSVLRELRGASAELRPAEMPFEVRVQCRYNPEGNTSYNVVPGLIGVILTMTMVMMTALAMTREAERGTMENLLATPVRPFEVMLGKIAPYIVIGYVQVSVILIASRLLFDVPMVGSIALLSGVMVLFIAAQLAVGVHLFNNSAQPVAGHAADLLLLPAVHVAVGLHVPIPWHAGLGAGDWRNRAVDAFPAGGARHHAEGQRLGGCDHAAVAHRAVHGGHGHGGAVALPRDSGLTAFLGEPERQGSRWPHTLGRQIGGCRRRWCAWLRGCPPGLRPSSLIPLRHAHQRHRVNWNAQRLNAGALARQPRSQDQGVMAFSAAASRRRAEGPGDSRGAECRGGLIPQPQW